jgi:aspartate kinase
MKFGGSCLDKPNDIRRMVEIIKSAEPTQPKVVLSAFKGTTDQLLNQAHSARDGKFDTSNIEARHHELVNELSVSTRKEIEPHVDSLLKELHNTLIAVRYLGELSANVLDKILSYGEKLATNIVTGYLAEEKLKGTPVSDVEAGILTNSNFGTASILSESSALVRKKLSTVHIPLIAGFFGKDESGRIATLGRGASDYVATFIAAAFGCNTILFKDVDGVMTADPKVVPNAKLIPNLDYEKAIELGRYGSKVLFEKAVIPAMNAQTSIEVKQFGKANTGTLISGQGSGEATSYIRDMSMVHVSGIRTLDNAASILHDLDSIYVDDPIATAFVFRNEMSIVTNQSRIDKVSEIARSISGDVQVRVRKDLSLVALIGKRFNQAKIYQTLHKTNIEPICALKTPTETTACIIVNRSEMEAAVRTLHDDLLMITR